MEIKTRWLTRLIIGVFVVANIGFVFGISSFDLKLGFLPLTMAISGINLGIILEMKPVRHLDRFIPILLCPSSIMTIVAIFTMHYPTSWWWVAAYSLDFLAISLAAIGIIHLRRNKQAPTQWHATPFFYLFFSLWQALVIPWIWLAQVPEVGPLTALLVESCGVGMIALLAWIGLIYHEQKHSASSQDSHAHPTSLATTD